MRDPARELVVEDVDLTHARSMKRIPSSYESSERLRLLRTRDAGSERWELSREAVAGGIHKTYDSGDLDGWLEMYAEYPGIDRLHFIQACVAGQPVGLLTWARMEWNDTLWLVDIRVRVSNRRNGVGSALLGRLQTHARRLRVRGMQVETQITNVPAVNFYTSHGFEICGFNDRLYTNGDYNSQDVALFLFWERR